MALIAPFAVASCSNGASDAESPYVSPTATATATSPATASDGGTAASCSTPSEGCACDAVDAQVSCGFVHQISGTYVSCSPGERTCGADKKWGPCYGDRVGDPASPSRGFILDNLQLDASTCDANVCDPSCQSFVDTANGVDASPDSGLVWNEAGVSLSPLIQDSGPPCTSATLLPATNAISVTYIPKTSDPASTLPTVTYPNGNQYSVTVAPAGCFAGTVVPALYIASRYDIETFGASTGLLNVVAGQATPSATPLSLKAYVGTLPVATASATVTVNATDMSAAGGYTVATNFPTTTGTAEPAGVQILYPLGNTMFPLSLPAPLVQWSNTKTSGTVVPASAVKITLRYPDTSPVFTWTAITTVETPAVSALDLLKTAAPSLHTAPRFQIDQNVWSAFEQTAKAGGTASISVQRILGGTSSTTPQAEMKTTFQFANGSLKGSVLYQSYGTNLVQDYSGAQAGGYFGAATLKVSIGQLAPTVVAGYTSEPSNTNGCRVCHSAAANGGLLISQQGNDYQSDYFDLTLATPVDTVIPNNSSTGILAWAGIDPTGTYLLSNSANSTTMIGSNSATSKLYGAKNGLVISGANVPSSLQAAMPAFSPDGKHVAFNYYSSDQKSLAEMDFDPVNVKFTTTPRVLDTPSTHDYWPAFFQNQAGTASQGVIFEREIAYNGRDFGGTRGNSDSAPAGAGTQGEIWWSSLDSSPQVHALTNANGGNATYPLPTGTNHTADQELNYEPTVNPQITGGYAWMIFTSRRLFGNVATLAPYASDPRYNDLRYEATPKKLWVAAIDPTAAKGTDPSFSAFYLPGQEMLAGNSRGYWVLNACEQPGTATANACDSDLDCCQSPSAEVCAAASSTPPIHKYCTAVPSSGTCAADGASCAVVGCCGALSGSQCVASVCQPPPPLVSYVGASFTRDYSGSTCPGGSTPVWRFLAWQSDTPGNSQIVFSVQTASSLALITSASNPPPVQVATAKSNASWSNPDQTPGWVTSPSTVDDDLKAAGQTSSNVLRLTANLQAGTSPATSPVLQDWRVTYDCVANQ